MKISIPISMTAYSTSKQTGVMPAPTFAALPISVVNAKAMSTSNAPFWPAFSPLNSILYADPPSTAASGSSKGIGNTVTSVAVSSVSDSIEVITKSITVVPLMVPDSSGSVSRRKKRSW